MHYSGFTTVSVDGFQLPICHAMEVVDVVADYFHDKLSNGEIDVVSFVSQMICEKYPHLKCSRDIPSPFRDDGMPSYTVNSELVYIREGYAAVDIADCVSSVKGYPFSSFVTLIKMFNSVFEIQLQYLTRMQRCGFSPSVILDCGAHVGHWSTGMQRKRFPEAKYLLIEANSDHEEALEKTGLPFEIALLGSDDGVDTVYYKNTDSGVSAGNSIFQENSPNKELREQFKEVRQLTSSIDGIVARHSIGKVDFLKLDLQGAETLALRGASNTLKEVEVIQAEIHLVNYNQGAPPFLELYTLLNREGFALYDIGEIQRFDISHSEGVVSNKIHAMDVVFVKKSSSLWEESCTLYPRPKYLDDVTPSS